MWKKAIIATPYLWLLVFFLAPFAIVLKISLADPLFAQPPYSQTVSLDNFAFLALLRCSFRTRLRCF